MEKLAIWMSSPDFVYLEIAHGMGFRGIVLDVEHGTFDLGSLDRFTAFARALGVAVHAKVLAPTVEAVQQALDFGAASVIIPHVRGVEHAREVAAAAKYPPLGARSYAGGRQMGYQRVDDAFLEQQNLRIKCYPMVETAEALADVEKITVLATVDGIFMGPTDLSLTRGRGSYAFTDSDRADIQRVAAAARAAGKPWIMPAWTAPERAFARELGAAMLIVGLQHGLIRAGFQALLDGLRQEGVII